MMFYARSLLLVLAWAQPGALPNVAKPSLPYAKDALEPHISAETLEYHFEKHHMGYYKKLQKHLNEDYPPRWKKMTLKELMDETVDTMGEQKTFNLAP
eukprot:UN16216